MSYFFVFYVEARYGYVYREPNPWFDVELISGISPDIIFHPSETHCIHKIGGYLKNFGLRNSLILEATTEADAIMLRLQQENLILSQPASKLRPPALQIILDNPDLEALENLCVPLEDIKKGDAKRRADTKAINSLQKNIDRVRLIVEDLDESLSSTFKSKCDIFMSNCQDEVERIRVENQSRSRKAAAARRKLQREMLKFASYTKTHDLK